MSADASPSSFTQTLRARSTLLPASILQRQFGKVYVCRCDGACHVEFTLWLNYLPGALAEGWQTGIGLDCSDSMKDWYGQSVQTLVLPPELMQEYEAKGWLRRKQVDGLSVRSLRNEAYQDARRRRLVKFTENIVEPLAREFIAYLASELDAQGGTAVVNWACGDGTRYELVGEFQESECSSLQLRGPRTFGFGRSTCLTPAVRFFVDRFRAAKRGLYVFLTDGQIDDMDALKKFTVELAGQIESGERNLVKCVLIGVGERIDQQQLLELDNLVTGTDVDIWDHKVASELRALSEIMVELVDENRLVGPPAKICDASGKVVARFTDGIPSRVSFKMDESSEFFEVQLDDRSIRQSVVAVP